MKTRALAIAALGAAVLPASAAAQDALATKKEKEAAAEAEKADKPDGRAFPDSTFEDRDPGDAAFPDSTFEDGDRRDEAFPDSTFEGRGPGDEAFPDSTFEERRLKRDREAFPDSTFDRKRKGDGDPDPEIRKPAPDRKGPG